MNRDQFRARVKDRLICQYGDGEIGDEDIDAIVADAGEYAAHMIEVYARSKPGKYEDIPVALCAEREHIANRLRAFIDAAPSDERSGARYVAASQVEAFLCELGVPRFDSAAEAT